QESGFILTPEEFGRVIAQQQMTAYPTSALPTVPQIGARAISSRELDALPQGSILTDGVRTDGEARVFVKDADGTWALHNRSGVEQATGFTSTDIEGISRIAGVVQEEFAGPIDATEAEVGVRVLATDESGVRIPFVKTASGRWARLDSNGNPVWPEFSQEDLFDSVDPASMLEFSRPRVAAGDLATIQDIRTAPIGSRIGVTTPDGASSDLIKTGVDEWSTAGTGQPLSESAISRVLSDEGASARFSRVGAGELTEADGVEFASTSPNTLRGADGSPLSSGSFVENPET